MSVETADLARALLDPAAVALVGASNDPDKNTARPQRYLARHGYRGRVVPINPGRDQVLGVRAWPRLADAPGPIDHVFVMVAHRLVPEVIEQCAEVGAKVATVYSDGFADAGPAGRARQDELLAVAHRAGVRILGPNCMGVVNVHRGLALTVNASLEAERLLGGPLSVISQSGSGLGAILSRGQARGFGFAKLFSVGNEADLATGELLDLLVDDPDTGAIAIFMETIRDGPRVASAARRAFAAGKPVLVYKLGRSAAGRAVALSHSGAMTGGAAAASAFFRAHGIVEVEMLETLFEAPVLLTGQRPRARGRIAVLTTTGGGAAPIVDRLGLLGVETAPVPDPVRARLAEAGVEVSPGPLIDVTMAGARPAIYGATLQGLLDAPECDGVVAVVGSSGQFRPEIAVRPVLAATPGDKPLLAYVVPQADASLRLFAEAGVPAFRTPEGCADAVQALWRWRAPAPPPGSAGEPAAAVRAWLAANAGAPINEFTGGALFAALGIARPATALMTAAEDLVDIAYPVVAKVASPDIAHKTEVGAVALGIADHAALAGAFRTLVAKVRAAQPRARIDGVLVQSMATGVGEVVLGYRRDREVGPLVTLGVGGVLAEIYCDVAVRVAPVSHDEAHDMIRSVKGLAPLRGYRGLPPGDLAALAAAVVAISELAGLPEIGEAEINPLLVRPPGDGVLALDALVAIAPPPGP